MAPLLAGLTALATGCDTAEQAGGPEPSSPEPATKNCAHEAEPARCLSDHYFTPARDVIPACGTEAGTIPSLEATQLLDLYRGEGPKDDDVAQVGGHLARYFSRYALRFAVTRPARPASLRYALNGTDITLDAALDDAGIPRGRELTPDEERLAQRALGDVLFAELRAFVAQAETEGESPGALNLLVVEHVLSPELAKALFGDSGAYVAGLGFSSRYLASLPPDDPDRALADMLGFPPRFTPLAIVGLEDPPAKDQGSLDNLVAHEVCHALGLQHVDEPGNLLQSGPTPSCEAPLSSAQLEALRLAVSPTVSPTRAALTARPPSTAITSSLAPTGLVRALLRRRASSPGYF